MCSSKGKKHLTVSIFRLQLVEDVCSSSNIRPTMTQTPKEELNWESLLGQTCLGICACWMRFVDARNKSVELLCLFSSPLPNFKFFLFSFYSLFHFARQSLSASFSRFSSLLVVALEKIPFRFFVCLLC